MTENLQTEQDDDVDLLDAALQVAEQMSSAEAFDELANGIAGRYAGRGDYDRAVDVADSVHDPFTQDKTLAAIAVRCAADGYENDAFALLESLEDLSHRASAMTQIAVARAEAGEYDRAIEIAHEMEDDSSTLAEIASRCAARGDVERALAIVETLDLDLSIAWALTQIAATEIKAGRGEDAIELLSRAVAAAVKIEPPDEKATTLADIALQYELAQQPEQAAEVLALALEAAAAAEHLYRDAAFGQIGASYARVKEYDRAVAVVEKIENVYQAASALVSIAAIESEDPARVESALELLSDASELLREAVPEEMNELLSRNNLFGRIAQQYAEAGRYDQAAEAASHIASDDDKYAALVNVAAVAARNKEPERALQIAANIADDYQKTLAHLRVSDALQETGEGAAAQEVLDKAIRLTDEVKGAFQRSRLKIEAAAACVRLDDVARMRELFQQALEDAKLIESDLHKASALVIFADKAAQVEYLLDERAKDALLELLPVS